MMIVGEEMIKSTKWDRKKFEDGSAPPKRAFKTYEEIGDHSFGDMITKKGHKEFRKCHFVKPKDWSGIMMRNGPKDVSLHLGDVWSLRIEDVESPPHSSIR